MRIHVVGIGGTGMSAVARILLARGHAVSGSDTGAWPLAEALARDGATVYRSFDPANVRGADVVLRSSAYGDANPEVDAALGAGILVWKREDAWRELSRGERVIAIAGTHGKTTTTALTWTALRAGGVDASLICGAPLRDIGTNAYAGRDRTLVIEADEYDRTFLALRPAIAVVTNVDHDHLDIFPTKAGYDDAFARFAAQTAVLIACADDPGARALGAARTIRYGAGPAADYRIGERVETAAGQTFLLTGPPGRGRVTLKLPGAHNALNTAAAVIAAVSCGIPLSTAADAFHGFNGTARRLEPLGEAAGVTVVDDYAHHPAEVRAAIAALRPRVPPGSRLVAVFQPHTPSRLAAFFDEFVAALATADERVVVETFASARERNAGGDARRLAERAGAAYAADALAAARELAGRVRRGDVVLILGAGDIRPAGERLLALLASPSPA
ncbi:MAG TPA: UDP-N-acetylmuramate--L-alanine ligase [Candidatus Limnocylindria bacterium]|nr:UDP-N-acetylmuramate--L-alanine ligase [Candidatus Limnocylindria bacterium]